MRVAVVGHVEWVSFARVERLPRQGEIVHALDAWEEAAGGGAVAAVVLAGLAGAAELFTAFGDDELGHRAHGELVERGLEVHAHFRETQRRGFTHTDFDGERTITVLGDRLVPHRSDPLPWERLADCDAVYFTGGDAGALRAARAARILVATPRTSEVLERAEVELDALVFSHDDERERAAAEALCPRPGTLVSTLGAEGGRWIHGDAPEYAWKCAALPGPLVDAYGAGDSFAAGLTYGLGEPGGDIESAVDLAARCGAQALTRRGAYGV